MPADANRPFGPTAMPERGVMLIVDDDAINCAILETIFSPYYATATAPDGRAGLEAILEKQDSLCAVLLDVIMPEMDGIQVLHALAERGLLEKIPVFLITAEASGSVMKEAYALGVMDVISKPVIPYVVLRRVQSVVELFRARERLSNVVELQQADLLAQAKKIISLNRGMIEALAAAIEFRSEESGEHVRRIHDITRALLTSTPLGEGLSRIEIEQIALASIMHDVGKIAVPDAILNKPGRLTAAEFEVMKSHTVQGARLLEQIPQLRGKRGLPLCLGHRPPPPRAVGRPGLPRRPERGRDHPVGADRLPGRRLRRAQLQAGVQRRLPPGKGERNDPHRGLRVLQPPAAGLFFQRGGPAPQAVR